MRPVSQNPEPEPPCKCLWIHPDGGHGNPSCPQFTARDAAVQAVKDHPSTTFMAPYESLADSVMDAAAPLVRAGTLAEVQTALLGTTDGDELHDDTAIPAGEIRRILAELAAPTEPMHTHTHRLYPEQCTEKCQADKAHVWTLACRRNHTPAQTDEEILRRMVAEGGAS